MAVVRQISESDGHKKQVAYVRCQFRRAHRSSTASVAPATEIGSQSYSFVCRTIARTAQGHLSTSADWNGCAKAVASPHDEFKRAIQRAQTRARQTSWMIQGRESEALPGPPNLTTLSRSERLRGSGESTLQTLTTHRPRGCARAAGHRQRNRPSGGVPARQLPLWTNTMASVAVRIAFQVILVLWLCLPEIASGRKLGHHFARPQP